MPFVTWVCFAVVFTVKVLLVALLLAIKVHVNPKLLADVHRLSFVVHFTTRAYKFEKMIRGGSFFSCFFC